MSGWLDIETAPRGKELILYEPDFKLGRNILQARIIIDTYPTSYPRNATHWMPLPKPPEQP